MHGRRLTGYLVEQGLLDHPIVRQLIAWRDAPLVAEPERRPAPIYSARSRDPICRARGIATGHHDLSALPRRGAKQLGARMGRVFAHLELDRDWQLSRTSTQPPEPVRRSD